MEREATEADYGVSNGDVEWLFRARSKKLAKQVNSGNQKGGRASGEKEKPEREQERQISGKGDSKGKNESQEQDSNREMLGSPKDTSVGPEVESRSEKGVLKDIFKRERSRSATLASNVVSQEANGRSGRRLSSGSIGTALKFSTSRDGWIPQNGGDLKGTVSKTGSGSSKTRSLFNTISSKFKRTGSESTTLVSPTEEPSSRRSSVTLSIKSDSSQGKERKMSDSYGSELQYSKERSQGSKEATYEKRIDSGACSKKYDTIDEKKREDDKNPLRRVNFSLDKLENDPQQQIPSRNPKKGNVLIPEDFVGTACKLSQGVYTNDNSGNKVPSQVDQKYSDKELAKARESQKRAQKEAEKHAMEAHKSARQLEYEVTHQRWKKSKDDDTEEVDPVQDLSLNLSAANRLGIDKPLHAHESYFDEEQELGNIASVSIANDSEPVLTLEQLYARCCHLREILPIPATLRQLKGKNKPVEVLKLLNPKPTLIDVLSFSDFISLVPIYSLVFDNVTLTTEMLRHLLGSLVNSNALEKLSLKNVPMDEFGWDLLCFFIRENRSVKKLDISQQKIKPETKSNCVRSSMNWQLLINSLAVRGGVEDLIINGCKLSDNDFKDLIEKTLRISTYRLGVASIDLNYNKAEFLAQWLCEPESSCIGLDLASNDLSKGQLGPFIRAFRERGLKLMFFSLNSTYLHDVKEASELLKSMVNLKRLRFLDLSCLPDLFPGIITTLDKYLPLYESIKRIHFDVNDLSTQSLSTIAEILPKILGLFHVSLLGNANIKQAAGPLYTAVKSSKSIYCLDIDYSVLSDELSRHIAFYLTRNMDMSMKTTGFISGNRYAGNNVNRSEQEELLFDGKLLMESAEKVLIESDSKSDNKTQLKMQRVVSDATMKRTEALRRGIHQKIDFYFNRRREGILTFDDKETLLRLCLLDASLAKVGRIIQEHAQSVAGNTSDGASPSVSRETVTSQSEKNQKGSGTLTPENNMKERNNSLTLHHDSRELLVSGASLIPHSNLSQGFPTNEQSLQPHHVVIEEGENGLQVPVDSLTGRPILMRQVSHTSMQAKRQEEEEGEFHKLGFFMQQRSSDDKSKAPDQNLPAVNVLPSGTELRDAVMEAKGIESVSALIERINNNSISFKSILANASNSPLVEKENPTEKTFDQRQPPKTMERNAMRSKLSDSISSIDSDDGQHENENKTGPVNEVVDKVYDKLLNDAERVRSNKQEN